MFLCLIRNHKKKRKLVRLSAFLLIFICIAPMLCTATASASAPYKSYTLNGYGYLEETQTAYLPYETLTKFDDEGLSNPNDLCVTKDGSIYIADTGNSRIVVGDLSGNLIQIIGEGVLKTPKGVYVTENKHIYVADRDAHAVFEFDETGEVLNTYTKPNSPLYGDTLEFLPIKVVVNDAGIMYIICESNTNGIIEISPTDGGTFLGYFGTNNTKRSLKTILYRAILTDQQRAKMVSNIPSTPDNLTIDAKGLIYTVTRGDKEDTLKRLNIAGKNIIKPDMYDTVPAAVAVGNHDNVFMASAQGYIYEFNNEGELIFIFAGPDDGTQRIGLSTLVTAIQVDRENRIYLLDQDKCQIQVFKPTEFTDLLHESLYLYSKGRYTESKEPLSQVLEMNSMFDYANRAMGRAYYQEENYTMALKYAKLSKDYEGYSDAYWEMRNQWLKQNVITVIGLVVGIWLLSKVIHHYDKKKGILNGYRIRKEKFHQIPMIRNLSYAWYFMKHPIDGCYGIAREKRASLSAANVLVVVFMAEYIINKYLCGFYLKMVREGKFELLSDIGIVVIVLLAVTACNYLVCTINEGEGTIKKIYCSFVYSLTPVITLLPVIFALSHMVTINEVFLVTFTKIIMYGWFLVLIVLSVKEVNNYTAKETFKVICLTVFTILILALLIFILYALWIQVFEFISAILGEVVYRLGY